MTLDEKLQELGVDMAAVNGLRKAGYLKDTRLQKFLDDDLGEHLKFAFDLVEETHNASSISDWMNLKYYDETHPVRVLAAAANASEILTQEKRKDLLKFWGNKLKEYFRKE